MVAKKNVDDLSKTELVAALTKVLQKSLLALETKEDTDVVVELQNEALGLVKVLYEKL